MHGYLKYIYNLIVYEKLKNAAIYSHMKHFDQCIHTFFKYK